MASIAYKHVTKTFGSQQVAVRDLTLDIHDQEFMVVVGPSGCGKSTALRLLAGLEDVTQGSIYIGNEDVTHVDARNRDIAMVFQSYALYPHMIVWDNLAFGLRMRHTPRREVVARVEEASRILELGDLLKRKPRQLSGGQRQRVALGRAIVRHPRAFLFDEPLSNLDAKLRTQTRLELQKLHERLGATFIYVTHDQIEAMTMGDRIAILRDGDLQQVASPKELYERPANLYVAGFIGSPSMNLIPATLEGRRARTSSFQLDLPEGPLSGEVILGIRPESLALNATECDAWIDMRVDVVEALGPDQYVYGKAGTDSITARLHPEVPVRAGDRVRLGVTARRVTLFDRKTERRLTCS
ncbi:MAG: ABC transporter ATP-binding protein [Candidatus Dormibacteraceae bacterium]